MTDSDDLEICHLSKDGQEESLTFDSVQITSAQYEDIRKAGPILTLPNVMHLGVLLIVRHCHGSICSCTIARSVSGGIGDGVDSASAGS